MSITALAINPEENVFAPRKRLHCGNVAAERVDQSAELRVATIVDRTTQRLIRAAVLFGVLSAAGPVITLAIGGLPSGIDSGPVAFVLAVCWLAWWVAAAAYPQCVTAPLVASRWRWPFVAALAAATTAGIAVTGGLSSPLQAGASWVAWPATVVLGPRVAVAIASTLSVATALGFVCAGHGATEIWHSSMRLSAVGSIANPLLIVGVGLAIAGMFRRVIVAAPELIWAIEHGAPASSPAIAALISGAPEAPMLGRSAGSGDELRSGAAVLADAPRDTSPPDHNAPAPLGERSGAAGRPLSALEHATIALLAGGHPVKQIATLQGRSATAVYASLASAREKLGARTNEHLVVLAWTPTVAHA